MNQAIPNNHSFPLEQLFFRLKMAGFAISPADRLRALQILNGPAKGYLHEPAKLKKLLAPALVRSSTEQEKFYEIFDLYFNEINRPFENDVEEEKKPYPAWLPWLLLVFVVGSLAYAAYSMWSKAPPPSDLSIYIEGPTYASVGDTVPFLNLSKYSGDSSELKWQWEYGTPGQESELVDSTQFNWTFVVPPLVNDVFQKEIRLSVYYPEKDSLFESKVDLSIFCPSAPAINKIIGSNQLNAEEEKTFTVSSSDLKINSSRGRPVIEGPAKNWTFDWDFGDGTTDKGGNYFVRHAYQDNGLYHLRLTVSDTTGEGFCSTVHTLEIKVGAEKAFLPVATLQEDQLKPLAVWDWAYYVLLGLLGIGIIYHWVRWLTRPKTQKEGTTANPRQRALQARFELNDKAPYFIPLRGQDQNIQSAAQQLRFADALRLRQQGLRKEINVSETLGATIQGGGFPAVVHRYATQPSEYLFLIDEQSRSSHLGRLFKYIAEGLGNQDVNMEVFYYRLQPNRFWNSHHPAGLKIDQLLKGFSSYRLVILGDAHELIDPHSQHQPHLRPEFVSIIRQWPQRLLLSPVPPVSWSYREKLLSRIFNVFPADVEGIAAAALHLENEGSLLSGQAFDQWKIKQTEQRSDSDTEHRKWRRWRGIEDYLSNYPEELTRWFKSLAVFPMISWEMTIAIGQALDIDITHDKLLQLARIPILQQDRFDERLRQELLAGLDKKDEAQARKAVREELQAVKSISTGSSASRDLETTLAIQSFSLDPEAEENRDTIRFLLEKGMLNPAQENELDWVSSKHVEQEQVAVKTKSIANSKRPSVNTREWLNAAEYVADDKPIEKKSRFNRDFWTALLLTISYSILLLAGWQLGGSDTLYEMVFWENPDQRKVGANDHLRDYYFVKESLVVDSAIIYNNQGVERSGLAQTQDTSTAHYFHKALSAANVLLKGNAETFNDKDITYSLANANLARLYYNTGVNYLNHYLGDSLGQSALPEALHVLDEAYISDSIASDVLHAKGVIHYYMGSPDDSTQYYYQILDSLNYFDDINYSPNLKTLMGREQSRILDVNVNSLDNQRLEVFIDTYIDRSIDQDVFITVTPIGKGKQAAEGTIELDGSLGTPKFILEPPTNSPGELASVLVELHRRPGNDVIDSKEIDYTHNWAPSKPTRNPRSQAQTGQLDANNQQKSLSFTIKGQVIDELSYKGIEGVKLEFNEQATRENRNYLSLQTVTGDYGEFSFEGELPLGLKSSLYLVATRDGYQTTQDYYTGDEIINLNVKEGLVVRLKVQIPRPKMVSISGGEFERQDERDVYQQQKVQSQNVPKQRVVVDNFLMSTYEVTYAQYDLFCEMAGREKPDDNGWGRGNIPVTQISWLDAARYCNWLSEQHNLTPVYSDGETIPSIRSGISPDININIAIDMNANGYRLPTEAEWEYAAKGGIMGDKSHVYAGSSDINEVAWYDGNSNNQAHPVGRKRPNNAGLYDMSGNVWEWCQDWYAPYASESETNPLGGEYGSDRIYRGGAWIQQADDCRIDLRRYTKFTEKSSLIGFRLVRRR